MSTLFLLALGFLALYFGAEWLVEGAADIAAHLNISKAVVGLTLVAFGTSAPELFVNVIAGLNDHSQFALSNIAGSNLTNLCLGLGLSSLFVIVPIPRRQFGIDLIFAALGPLLVVASFAMTDPPALSWRALVPMGVLGSLYVVTLFRRFPASEPQDPTHLTLHKPLGLFAVGVVALYVGGRIVFVNATALAASWQVPEQIVGLTIVACGTSIPDVTASIVAARRGEHAIAVGNILGSNISNVFVVLSGTLLAAGHGLPADAALIVDYTAVALLSIAFGGWVFSTGRLRRAPGIALLILFVAYFTARILV